MNCSCSRFYSRKGYLNIVVFRNKRTNLSILLIIIRLDHFDFIILNLLMKLLVIACIILSFARALPNQAPIIGIYTQSDQSDEPTSVSDGAKAEVSNYSYIAASYVKYIQMSGAQVVPIFAYSNQSYFDQLLPKINGVLFPGGDTDFDIRTPWTKNAQYILKYAMEQNKKGNVFPVWGTCLGMQLLAYLTCGYDDKAIADVRGEIKIRNTIEIEPDSILFRDLPASVRYNAENGNGILYFNHHFAVTKDYFDRSEPLKNFWAVEAYTTSPYNQRFLSVFRAKEYPFYGVQFHPQKNLYQWKVYADRSSYGVEIVQYLSNKFVEYARQSKNKFDSYEDFKKMSIYNYKTQFTTQSFIQIYLFNEPNINAHLNQADKNSHNNNQNMLTIETQ